MCPFAPVGAALHWSLRMAGCRLFPAGRRGTGPRIAHGLVDRVRQHGGERPAAKLVADLVPEHVNGQFVVDAPPVRLPALQPGPLLVGNEPLEGEAPGTVRQDEAVGVLAVEVLARGELDHSRCPLTEPCAKNLTGMIKWKDEPVEEACSRSGRARASSL